MTIFSTKGERTCRGCGCTGCTGCTDSNACVTEEGPCAWVLVDVHSPTGICSACAADFEWHPALLASAGFEDDPRLAGAR
ncbi:MAG: hypothetical protein ACREQD_05040 [Candidatus Binataceae bacterium]